MEPISEERQRKIIGWLNPDLANKDWGLCNGNGVMPRRASWYEPIPNMLARRNFTKELEPLYVWDKERNWVPNYQFFFTEIVPRLQGNDARIEYANERYWISDKSQWPARFRVIDNPDPIAATAEYVEALEGE